MRVGFGLLRLAPSVFWSMTLREFAAAIEGALGPATAPDVLDRRSFDALLARYPDR